MRVLIFLIFISRLFAQSGTDKLTPFAYQGKYGYLDSSFNVVVEPDYFAANFFSEGVAAVKIDQESWQILNESMDIIGTVVADQVEEFSDGLAVFTIQRMYGFVDSSGEKIFSGYEHARSFSEGRASVSKDGRAFFINVNGNNDLGRYFEHAGRFRDGIAIVWSSGIFDNRCSFIDTRGFLYSTEYENIAYFSDGLARISEGKRFGYIDKKGEIAIKPVFFIASMFYNGVATVQYKLPPQRFKLSPYWAFINKKGEIIKAFDENILYLSGFSEGLCTFHQRDTGWGYMDTAGHIVIEPQFDFSFSFRNGLALVSKNNEMGYVNKDGDYMSVTEIMERYEAAR